MTSIRRMAILTVIMLLPAGCNTSTSGGMPGTKDSFTVTAPSMTTTIKQGDRHTVKLTLDRGSDFKRVVKFDVQAPSGLTVSIEPKMVAAGAPSDIALSVEADKTAALGEHKITVTATPDGGSATSVDVKINVESPKS